jgi:hypothetical protein
MLVTVSSGIGSRLYDHRARRIPYDCSHGVQGEIGHLVFPFELDGKLINRPCECGGWNHMNAFASGRGIAQTLRNLPALTARFGEMFLDSPDSWLHASDEYRLHAFQSRIEDKTRRPSDSWMPSLHHCHEHWQRHCLWTLKSIASSSQEGWLRDWAIITGRRCGERSCAMGCTRSPTATLTTSRAVCAGSMQMTFRACAAPEFSR